MDRLDAMLVFLAVVDTGSLSAAGRRLQAPLPTVSRKVAELERHLISAYVAGAGEDLHQLQTRTDEAARHLLAEASRYASMKLSEIEARFHYLHMLHGDSSGNA